MMAFKDWPLWKRALWLNGTTIVGAALGVASGGTALIEIGVRVSVFLIAFANFMFFVVLPRASMARAEGQNTTAMRTFVRIVWEQPLAFVVLAILVAGSSQAAASAAVFARPAVRAYAGSLPNGAILIHRMWAMLFVMATVSAVWLLGAVGFWARRPWGWWLALILNGLAAATTAVIQVLVPHRYMLDAFATIAVVLLLLPRVRKRFRRVQLAGQPG